jgi:uncharacterized protein YyaL (SSP411 family)
MNSHFINIKVDREEYPDVDHLYQSFVQATTGRGGWPLNVFLTPDKIPFYGGTYFPAKARYGMISFPDLLSKINDIYQNEPDRIAENKGEIRSFLKKLGKTEASEQLPDPANSFENLLRSLENSYDPVYGGFSIAPKFPHVSDMEFLLTHYHYAGNQKARDMVLHTLKTMAQGGIYDQIGGGFARYSTDEKWHVPHFEKMLYDNALLIPLFVNAYQLTGDDFYKRVGQETADFVLHELHSPEGTFYSALDADSEGEEGKFYVWEYEEIRSLLDDEIKELFCEYYHVEPSGNYEGKNILYPARPLQTITQNCGLSVEVAAEKITEAKKILLQKRNSRVRPGLDNKVLTDWNGMMISALWKIFEVTDMPRYRDAADRALHHLLDNSIEENGHVYHFNKNNQEKIDGYIDDYAYLIKALIDGFEVTQEISYLEKAQRICDYSLKNFWDDPSGGFYFTHQHSDTTIVRLKQIYDASTPAGNSVMAMNLLKLYAYTGQEDYLHKTEQLFRSQKSDMEIRGAALSKLIKAFLWYHNSPLEFTISLPVSDGQSQILPKIWQLYVPFRVLLVIGNDFQSKLISPDLIKNRQTENQEAVYICHKNTCSLPVIDADQFSEIIHSLNLHID